jgi:hypothetical protein
MTINFIGKFEAENDEIRVEQIHGLQNVIKIFGGGGRGARLNLLPTARVLLAMSSGNAFIKNCLEKLIRLFSFHTTRIA